MSDGSWLHQIVSFAAQIGTTPDDSAEIRLQKTLLVISACMMASLAIIWALSIWPAGVTIQQSFPGSIR